MSSPKITYGHINSIYVNSYKWNIYELGWKWMKADTGNPRYFYVIVEGARFQTPETGVDLGSVPAAHRGSLSNPVQFSVNLDSWVSGSPLRLFIDWVQVGPTNWRVQTVDGLSIWGSERFRRDESNYARFWEMAKRSHANTWSGWQGVNGYNPQSDHAELPTATLGPYHLFKVSNDVRYGYSNPTGGTGLTHIDSIVPDFHY